MFESKRWWIVPGIAFLLLAALISFWPVPNTEAQCGSQASSCKNCHEVQGQDAVNTKGAWHTDHAFGDFCEFCHGGNVQATDKTAAHEGLVAWNADVKASCASCHATDYEDRAQTYASTLGVEVNSGSAGSGGGATGNITGTTGVAAPLGGEEIDFNLLYAQATDPRPLVANWGNLILVLMILGTGGAFFVTAWTWEGWGPKVAAWIRTNVSPVPKAVAAVSANGDCGEVTAQALAQGDSAQVAALIERNPELRDLLPRLMDCRPDTLQAIGAILANPERGAAILATISKVDQEVVAALQKIGARDRNLLAALLTEI